MKQLTLTEYQPDHVPYLIDSHEALLFNTFIYYLNFFTPVNHLRNYE